MKKSILLGVMLLISIMVFADDPDDVTINGKLGIGILDPDENVETKGNVKVLEETETSEERYGLFNASRIKFGWDDEGDRQCGFFHDNVNQLSVGFWDENADCVKSSMEFFPGGLVIGDWNTSVASSVVPKLALTGTYMFFDNGDPEEEGEISSYLDNQKLKLFNEQDGTKYSHLDISLLKFYDSQADNTFTINRDTGLSIFKSTGTDISGYTYTYSFGKPMYNESGEITGVENSYTYLPRFIQTGVLPTPMPMTYFFRGTVAATNLKVREIDDTTFWPDYVFKEDYQLMPLHELNNYVSENNHLPNVPTQSDIKENGIDIVENQAVLLKKIEELTLYIIELEKRNNEQNEVLEQVKAQLQTLEEKTN